MVCNAVFGLRQVAAKRAAKRASEAKLGPAGKKDEAASKRPAAKATKLTVR
jgi:hypothetical protein